MKADPRRTAMNILDTLENGRRTLDDVVGDLLNRRALPEKRDRALTTALVYGVLRRRLTLDWVIGQFSDTAFDKIDPVVRSALRLGLYQLLFMDRIPEYAAVNASVNLVKSAVGPRPANFVNGVLRTAVRRRQNLVYPDQAADPVKWLSVTRSFPEWMIRRWIIRYGPADTVRLCDTINRVPPITVRVNTLKSDYARVREALGREAARVADGLYAPDAISLEAPKESIEDLRGFQDGWFQVQDEAAQLACLLLNPRPGERILDACAGLGGKTGYLAQLMKNRGTITAIDADGRKLEALAGEMERLGATMVATRRIDWLNNRSRQVLERFDGILADCPCSGMGVLRRNPDIKWSASARQLARHRDRQAGLLSALADLVRPGRCLVYVVCSTEPEENDQVIDLFLKRHSDFMVDLAPAGPAAAARRFIDRQGFFRTMVYPHAVDGFFGVRLKKKRS